MSVDVDEQVERLKKVAAQVHQYESVPGRRHAIESASWEPTVPVQPDELNSRPMLLNVLNGTLDLDTIELREHRRMDLLTQIAPVVHDPRATCPLFVAFLEEVLPDAEVRSFVQRAFGYSCTGHVREHVLLFLHGHGKNGKSTALNALLDTLGSEYAAPAPPKLIIKRGREEHLTEIADLFGKRLVVCSESGEDARLDEEKLKWLTGGDRLKARRMREDMWSFAPSHTFWLHSNYQPRIEGTDEGIWRRVLQVPFEVQPREVDLDLGRKLQKERSGILNWGLEGLRAYLERGLDPPKGVRMATEQYRADQDIVGRFLVECVTSQVGGRLKAAELHERFERWCRENGERTRSGTWLGSELVKRGLQKVVSNGVRYLDVRLVQ